MLLTFEKDLEDSLLSKSFAIINSCFRSLFVSVLNYFEVKETNSRDT